MRNLMAATATALGMGFLGMMPAQADQVTWGDGTTGNTAAGILDGTSIPTNGTVRFNNVYNQGYDIVFTTTSLNQSSGGNLGVSAASISTWFFEGAAASSLGQSIPYSTVEVHFYATGTNDPYYLTGLNFQFVDAEVDERFRNFGYFTAHGDFVPFATTADPIGASNSALSYSGGSPNLHFSDSSFDTGASTEGGTQTSKWIQLNLSTQAISGFKFQAGRASSNNGSVEVTGLGDLVHQMQAIGSGAAVTPGISYDGLTSTSATTNATQAQLLGGVASTNTTVTVNFTLTGTSGFQAGQNPVSDVVSLHGTNGDKVVLQLSYNPALLGGQLAANTFLGWFDPNDSTFKNAVLGNVNLPGEANNPTSILGAYDPTTDFHLGYYGVDTVNHVVWAVIDHNSDFVATVPEPATAGFLVFGASLLMARRARRRA